MNRRIQKKHNVQQLTAWMPTDVFVSAYGNRRLVMRFLKDERRKNRARVAPRNQCVFWRPTVCVVAGVGVVY